MKCGVESAMANHIANLKKTVYYLERNGIRNTWYAVWERLRQNRHSEYHFVPLEEVEAERQRQEACADDFSWKGKFSIVVPTFRTKEIYLKEMITSVIEQTYSDWELILADATEDDSVERVVRTYEDSRIQYHRLASNEGISENTNKGLAFATGNYIGLLDHDDVLTSDALYEMAFAIGQSCQEGRPAQILYSDEDKCNGDRTNYYEPHKKQKFNLDLILSNNYICHFMLMDANLLKKVGFRREYDGAQDYDCVLRAISELIKQDNGAVEEAIKHIPKVLYHWRCHSGSTAENPRSKDYAYVAGKRALQDFADSHGWNATAVDLKHLGFYQLVYGNGNVGEIFFSRPDIGAVGGKVIEKGKIFAGRYGEDGGTYYHNLPKNHSGYMHCAVLHQSAFAVDLRCICLREECYDLFASVVGVPYSTISNPENKDQTIFDITTLPVGADIPALSMALGAALHTAGYRILWNPELVTCVTNSNYK